MNNYFYLQAVDTYAVIKLVNTNDNTPDIKFSRDGNVWYQWDYTNLTINANTKIYFKGDNGINFSKYKEGIFRLSTFRIVSGGKVLAGGNIMSLLDDGACTRTEVGDFCFYNLFYNLGGLDIDVSFKLQATKLGASCYYAMFYGTSLTKAPALPATTLAINCYREMFVGCNSLTTAPDLPATTLTNYCYDSMFYQCTSLTKAPALPATTLAINCYSSMFQGCTSLTKAPEIPAINLASSCCSYMFKDCTNLTTAPTILPATTLEDSCYSNMFKGCTSLTKAPELPATTLKTDCYKNMFYDCSKLNYIKALFTTTPSTSYTSTWVSGVATDGTFVKNKDATWSFIGNSAIPTGWTVKYFEATYDGLTFTAIENSTISLSNVGGNNPDIWYSNNTVDWTKWNYSNIELTKDSKIYFKGNNGTSFSKSTSQYSQFVMTGKIAASGNIMSLLDNGACTSTEVGECCFANLFKDCKVLTTPPTLPATTLAVGCYRFLFSGCTSLTTAPSLPATALKKECYLNLFSGCTSLTSAPSLPATTMAEHCYRNLFNGCSNLTSAPELPATALAISCYTNMFYGCSKLTTPPVLPATTLAEGCYQALLYNCTSLTTAPELPATTLAPTCYKNLFQGCTSLTTAPELNAETLVSNCYTNMFYGCSKLNYIKALFTTTPSTTYTSNWVNGVASTGTFVKNREATWDVTGVNAIPTGWSVETYPPTITYTLTVRGNNSRLTNGSSTNIGDATFDVSAVYEAGTSVTIGCRPKSGYRFVQWNDGNTNSERTVVVNSDITYTATVVKTYRIIAQDESVHHCYVRGTGVYDENSVAELTVVPFEGYMFSHWEDNSTDLPRYITVTEDKTVWAEAVLAPQEYTITLQGDNCTLNGGGTYNEGTTVEISCIPNTGYYFVRWSDGNTNATRTITVTEDITLTAITAQGSSEYLEIKARKGSGEYERTNIIWYLDYKVNSFIWDARVYTDFDNLTTNFEISDDRVTNISKGSSWIGDSRIYSFDMTVPRNDSDTNKEFTINITSNNGIMSDNITIRVIQKPKLPVLIEDIFVSSGDVENALVTIPDTMGEVLVVYEDETLARYTIDDCVSNYVLYYRNALGGIDLFPVTGKVIKSNNIEHLTINKKYDNRTLNFGKTNYENVLTERWQLYSGRLTDQQSKLMHHLINSTYVYLYDIQADKFTPVVITDTEMEYKTYKNNNNKMVYYTINVEASQTKYRR